MTQSTIVAYNRQDATDKKTKIIGMFQTTVTERTGFLDNNGHPTEIIALDVEGVNEADLMCLFN